MRAIELQNGFGIDNLAQTEKPNPQPGFGEILLRMRAWSLNYRDLLVVKGTYNPRLRFPMMPLSDGVGEVVAVGEGVTRVKVGERVAGCFMQRWLAGPLTDEGARSSLGGGGPGMLAEQVVLNQDGVVSVPAHLSDEEAACLPCAAVTAWNALIHSGSLTPGSVILTQGTGGVSLFAVQFARLMGVRCIVTSSSDEKLARARELGASEGINYRTVTDWDKKARELTGDVGVDHIVELGGAGTLGRSLKAVRMGGRISLIGVLAGGTGEVNPLPALMKGVCIQGIYVGSREMFEQMNRAISLASLRPTVDRVFAMDQIQDALRHLESGSHFGKIVLRA